MTNPVRSHNSIMILHVADIVPDRNAENIGKLAARFFKNDLRAARIPELGPLR